MNLLEIVNKAREKCSVTGGALSTICWVMPVSPVIKLGMRTPQLISDT